MKISKTILIASAGFILLAAIGFAAYKYFGYGRRTFPKPLPIAYSQYYMHHRPIIGHRNRQFQKPLFHRFGYGPGISFAAEKLGMTEEELRTKLQTKTMLEIAQEKSFTPEEFQQLMKNAAMERWEKIGLTDEQINNRLEIINERQQNCMLEGYLN